MRNGLGEMEEEPLVSVVINCYNGEKYLKEAIDSVYAQTYKNWEIVFWDNASTDKTEEIAKSYDNKLKYFRSDSNSLLGEARVRATKKAKGKYLAFLDCDDFWEPTKLSKQVILFVGSKDIIGMVYGRTAIVSSSNNETYIPMEHKLLYSGDIFERLARKNIDIIFSSVMVDKDIFFECGGFDEFLMSSTDYSLYLNISKKYLVNALQCVCCNYRIHNENLSRKLFIQTAKESVDALSTHLPDARAYKGLKYLYAMLVIAHIKEKKYVDAVFLMFKKRVFYYVGKGVLDYLYRSLKNR